MVNTRIMSLKIKKVLVLIFWMGFASGSVILIDSFLSVPDEISGVLYFLSIGVAASSVLNHYR
ncbi:MAG: hypothetical protein CBD66_001070 [Flavobacteriaceae bacterium TMED206]|nr:MAG: hypothetical protein CBD66_001070 [Flavobacteriaceae bacterium TMED206]